MVWFYNTFSFPLPFDFRTVFFSIFIFKRLTFFFFSFVFLYTHFGTHNMGYILFFYSSSPLEVVEGQTILTNCLISTLFIFLLPFSLHAARLFLEAHIFPINYVVHPQIVIVNFSTSFFLFFFKSLALLQTTNTHLKAGHTKAEMKYCGYEKLV